MEESEHEVCQCYVYDNMHFDCLYLNTLVFYLFIYLFIYLLKHSCTHNQV